MPSMIGTAWRLFSGVWNRIQSLLLSSTQLQILVRGTHTQAHTRDMPTNTLSLCSGLVTDDMCQVQSNTLSKLKRFCGTSCKFQTETAREKENEADVKECEEEWARQRDRELTQQLSLGTRSWSWKRAKAATTIRGYNFRLPSAAHVCAEACVCVCLSVCECVEERYRVWLCFYFCGIAY